MPVNEREMMPIFFHNRKGIFLVLAPEHMAIIQYNSKKTNKIDLKEKNLICFVG
jgi:hypothetical protein